MAEPPAPSPTSTRSVRTQVGDAELTLSNLDKVLYPSVGFTKAEVIAYYSAIAGTILPYVCDRALTRVRFPDGVDASSFYEKNAPQGTPSWVSTALVDTSDGLIHYAVCDKIETLVWLANLAALELHVPQWRISSATPRPDGAIELSHNEPKPGEPLADRVVVDLDPGEGMTIIETARAALIVARLMAEDGLLPTPQTSGSKGIQVYAAVRPCRSRDVWAYVKHLNASLARRMPDFFVATMSIAQRKGRIYVDYNQNLAARNTIAPYSMRGRHLPSVATPVTWEEIGSVAGPDDLRFTPDDVLARVKERGDLAADLLVADRPPLPDVPADKG